MNTKPWAERFDEEFKLDNYGSSNAVQRKVKAFISQVEQEATERERARLRELISPLPKESIFRLYALEEAIRPPTKHND